MSNLLGAGPLNKMVGQLPAADQSQEAVAYSLPLGDQLIPLNKLLGQKIRLVFQGSIHCTHCGRKTSKSYSQGFCYPCFKSLARCDLCIMSPEKCHFDAGTCREPEWGESFCMTDHIVYLANSSNPKVGITRLSQIPTRWIDQGAVQALPIYRVPTRQLSGFVEDCLREHIADKTNWRAMLKGESAEVDLQQLAVELIELSEFGLTEIENHYGLQALQRISDQPVQNIHYPVLEYPSKIKTHNFDKTACVEGCLLGIKGQYLILDTGVINIRKFTAYPVELSA